MELTDNQTSKLAASGSIDATFVPAELFAGNAANKGAVVSFSPVCSSRYLANQESLFVKLELITCWPGLRDLCIVPGLHLDSKWRLHAVPAGAERAGA